MNFRILYFTLLLCFIFTPSKKVLSQSYIYKTEFGTHIYSSTVSTFLGEIEDYSGPTMQIYAALGKNAQRGYFVLEARGVWQGDYLVGNITIYTKNGEKISCTDRKLFTNYNDNGDQKTASLYYLTFSELKSLEENGVSKIYFTKSDEYDVDRNRYALNTSAFFD